MVKYALISPHMPSTRHMTLMLFWHYTAAAPARGYNTTRKILLAATGLDARFHVEDARRLALRDSATGMRGARSESPRSDESHDIFAFVKEARTR